MVDEVMVQTKLGITPKMFGCPWCPNYHTFSREEQREHLLIGKAPGYPICRKDHKRAIYMLDLEKSRKENKKWCGNRERYREK